MDAGKSTLMGHMLYQLGVVNKKAMHKYEQESKKLGKGSFAYAWVLDETEEERYVELQFVCTAIIFQTENISLNYSYHFFPFFLNIEMYFRKCTFENVLYYGCRPIHKRDG